MRPFLHALCAAAILAAGCGDGGSKLETHDPTAPDDGVVVWAVGDGGEDEPDDRGVVLLISRDDPEHIIYLGDVYEAGTPSEFETFAEVWGPLAERMWPTPGNHEWANHATGYDPFWRRTLGEPLPHHYARRVGGWDILSANSETPDDREQLRWLREQASRGGGNCRIAFWHSPRLNAGSHRDEQDEVAGLWDAVAGRAAIVLSGHDHNLQRFKPLDGTTQYIAGAGGRANHGVDEDDPRLAFSDDGADGALRITLRPGSADLRFITADGTVLDRSTVACEG
jgi:acid phosphatase type 7